MENELESLWQSMKGTHYNRIIDEMKDEVQKAANVDEAFRVSLNRAVEAAHAEAGTVWVYDRLNDGLIRSKYVYGGSALDSITLRPGEGVAGEVIRNGQTSIISDCQKDPRWAGKVDQKTGFKTLTMLCVPLKWKQITFGCIQLINRKDGSYYDDNDSFFAERLANEFSAGLEENGMLEDYIGRDYLLTDRANIPADTYGITTIFDIEDFDLFIEIIQDTSIYRSLGKTEKKTFLYHIREMWRMVHRERV